MAEETPAQPTAGERRHHPLTASDWPPSKGNHLFAGFHSIQDTFSSRHHSLDFAFSHAHYLRSRVLSVGLIFTLLSPLWIAVDAMVLPPELFDHSVIGRSVLLLGLVGVLLLAKFSRGRIRRTRLCAGLLLALPAAFYALVLLMLPAEAVPDLVGYNFIPFLLVASLSVFPFTILESLLAGLALLGLLILSQLIDGSWMTGSGIESLWLLSSLMVVSMAANHFQLSLLLRIYRQATHDPLTGLFNRGALEVYLDKVQAWQNSRRRAENAPEGVPCSILMLDIDHFKRINDTHGHSVGDLVLRQFADILTRQTREQDCAARYGGEEFVVILVDSDPARARQVAERIRRAVETFHFIDHAQARVPVTVSIGVTQLERDEPAREALRRADATLYRAKREGRNRVTLAT